MAVKGKGAKLWLWDAEASTPALAQISELLSVTPPAPTRDTVDTTHHGSPGDYREFIAHLIDAGEASASIHYVPDTATDQLLNRVFTSGAITPWAIDVNKVTGQQRLSGSAILTNYAPQDVVIEGKMTATITLKVSGAIVSSAAPNGA